ncbi:MAG: transposase [Fibrobacter sp.]|nr:transposase [Fibrobacter sp.]
MAAKVQHFLELSKFLEDKESVCRDFLSLLDVLRIGNTLEKLEMEKEKGVSSKDLLKCLLVFRLCGLSIYQSSLQDFGNMVDGGKNQFYRFLNRKNMDWRRLLLSVTKSVVRKIVKESEDASLSDWKYAIIDDSTLGKTGFTIEGVTKVYDHVSKQYVLGYKLNTLALTDGKTTLPIDFALHCEEHKDKMGGLTKKQKANRHKTKREEGDCTNARISEMTGKKTDVSIQMLRRAWKNGFRPEYLLIDKWYCNHSFISEVRKIGNGGIHVVTLLRDKRVKFVVNGKTKSAKMLCKEHETDLHQCRKYKCRYVRVDADWNGMPVRLFLVRYKHSTEWEVLLTTDMKLTFVKAFETYQQRWNIEVLFGECKRHLDLGGCQSTNLNAQLADCTLVFIGYSVIALRKRFSDYETWGALFRDIQRDLIQLTLIERLLPMIEQIIEVVAGLCDMPLIELMERLTTDDNTQAKILFLLKNYQQFKDQ